MRQPGDRIGAYEVVAPLRKGGMATLYIGRRTGALGFTKQVAIKVVRPELAKDEELVKMLIDEAKLAVRIRHPNVVQVEELGEDGGLPFLVMEYIHGCSIAQLLSALESQGRRMKPELAVHVALAAADALHTAHEVRDDDGAYLGLVHRDISPQNVLVSRNGHVKVIDFGIAKARGRAIKATSAGTIKGKFRYMSPEQARSQPLDRRTDIYSLGIVLWEMLTSRRLFDMEEDVEVLIAARDPEHPPPSGFADGIPEALDEAVMTALAKSPDDRPATALDLRRMLIRAMPEAAVLDSTAIARLLEATLAGEMDADLSALPRELSVILRGQGSPVDPTAATGIVEELTKATVVR